MLYFGVLVMYGVVCCSIVIGKKKKKGVSVLDDFFYFLLESNTSVWESLFLTCIFYLLTNELAIAIAKTLALVNSTISYLTDNVPDDKTAPAVTKVRTAVPNNSLKELYIRLDDEFHMTSSSKAGEMFGIPILWDIIEIEVVLKLFYIFLNCGLDILYFVFY